ncbi:RNA polymerase sigma-70 factor (ECF subfamily) [Mucilaginibacter oryzae]|uniref:RNA polymerase sigma-70 factor (ECF subfamily) n=1 Tax=Mucilaginibacter oryzae TaxID=468058 RepID=A0A316HID0_9SPHI|nr:RNA polymerase sigma-70 factor [Mucilaginibacter oryzae]PWK79903.1 RNA polymerase sigma-70 factor (ECF subfamily) [Mucilaginibacter oryzae]
MNIQELVHLIRFDDDEAAFNRLYRLQVNKLYQFAYSFLGDKEPAEEIVNDLFLKIWLNRSSLDSIRNMQVYMYVTVKNACLNYLRGTLMKQSKEASIAEAYYFHLSVDPAQLLIGKELQSDILAAVDSLPPRCKLIFKMVKQDGLSCREVADILNLSHKTVFAQLVIALKRLESVIK